MILWTAAHQASLSITSPKFAHTLVHRVGDAIQPSHPLSSLLRLPSIFPSIRVFSNESALCIRWPQYWNFSFTSVLPKNIQDSFPLGLTGLISFRVQGIPLRDSEEFSPAPQLENINPLAFSLLYGPTLTSIHDYWKNHSFDYTDLCQQSNVSVF